jgi:hypothetical protein
MAARQIGKSVGTRFVAGTMSFTKAVKITPITSPIKPERIARNKEIFLIVNAPQAASREKVMKAHL